MLKTFLFVILISVLTGYLCLSYAIGNNDVYIYKVAKYCGELSRERMLYKDSYKIKHLNVSVKARNSDYLEKQIEEENNTSKKFYGYSFDKSPLYLYGLFVEVTYYAKNSLNQLMQGKGVCEFDTFALHSKVLSYPKIKQIDIGGKIYYPDEILVNFNTNKAGLLDVSNIDFFDKFNYIFNKKEIDIIYH